MEKILSSQMADAKLDELNTRRNAIAEQVAEKRSTFESTDVETRDAILDELTNLEAEVTQIDEDIAEVTEIRQKFAEQEERLSLMNNVTPVKVEERAKEIVKDIYDTPEYRSAWVNYVKTGNDKEVRALTTATNYVPIPTLMQGYVETAWAKYGKFSQLVSKTYVKGYLAIPVEVAADPAVWHDEGSEMPQEETITLGQILLQPKMIKKWISMTDELMAMAPDEFMRYVSEELVYRVIKLLDDAIINRTDVSGKGVIGIVGNANTVQVTQALSFNAINVAVAELITWENLTVAMNPKTFFNNIMGLTDLQGRPIYQIASDNTGKPQYFINGIRIEFTDALPAYDTASAGAAWAVVGDFRGYRLNLPEGDGVVTLMDQLSLSREDKAYMLGRIYAAGNVTRLKHFAQLNKAA